MTELAEKNCVPCRGGVPALKGPELAALASQLPEWRVVDEHHINRSFKFKNFRAALEFVNRVGELAEQQGHHPDIFLASASAQVAGSTAAVACTFACRFTSS